MKVAWLPCSAIGVQCFDILLVESWFLLRPADAAVRARLES